MPILLKKIEANIISLFGDSDGDFAGKVKLINSVVGEAGIEDYIKLTNYEAFTQDFSSVIDEGGFCEFTPSIYGLTQCDDYTDLNISY